MLMRSGLAVVTLLLTMTASAAGARDPYSHFFHESFGDYREELATANSDGLQGVMLFFEMDECPFCQWMKQQVLSQPAVQEYYRQHFRLLAVDIEGDVEITDFSGNTMSQKQFAEKVNRVRATPVIQFYDQSGNVVHRFTGRTRDAAEFLLMGRFVVEGHYRTTSFSRFKREQGK